eukprot:289771-Pelagomonas_calceolata.AAC.2
MDVTGCSMLPCTTGATPDFTDLTSTATALCTRCPLHPPHSMNVTDCNLLPCTTGANTPQPTRSLHGRNHLLHGRDRQNHNCVTMQQATPPLDPPTHFMDVTGRTTTV